MSMMRALSVRQPWAWLLVNGHKDIENRDWKIDYRGPLVIHASNRYGKEQIDDYMHVQHKFDQFKMPPLQDMPRGGIVGILDVIDCVSESASPWFLGKYGWRVNNARPLRFVHLSGRLGLFAVPRSLLEELPPSPKDQPR